jgi:hypothetical protein
MTTKTILTAVALLAIAQTGRAGDNCAAIIESGQQVIAATREAVNGIAKQDKDTGAMLRGDARRWTEAGTLQDKSLCVKLPDLLQNRNQLLDSAAKAEAAAVKITRLTASW